MRMIFVLAAVLLAAEAVYADDGVLTVLDHGVYRSGSEGPQLLLQTDRIPAEVGTVFGLRVNGGVARELSYRWTFPQMTQPETGRVWTEMSGTQSLAVGGATPFFARFNHDWETVPGQWTLHLFDGDQLVVERVFVVELTPD
ncbi:MAG: DUF3859 domain-containing protein [Xanthomonadales bacterium]|nr:DUF3859 domain-containing protein [Xanthomonadales bacterium]